LKHPGFCRSQHRGNKPFCSGAPCFFRLLDFLNSPSREFSDGIVQRLRKQSIYSCRRARRAGGPICTLGIGKSTFDCGLVRTSSLDRSTQRTQLPQNGTFLLVRRATGRVPDAGNHVNRWFFAGRSWVAVRARASDDGSTWATCQLITVPWSRPRVRWVTTSSRQPKRLKFKNQTGGKAVPPSGRGHFATNMSLLLLFVHGTRCPFLCLLLPRSVLCSLQYVAEKKLSDCCVLCCVLCRWTGLTCWLLPSPLLSPARCDACFDATNFRGMM